MPCCLLQVVEPAKAHVDADVAKAEEAANAASAIKKECEDALAEAMPILVGSSSSSSVLATAFFVLGIDATALCKAALAEVMPTLVGSSSSSSVIATALFVLGIDATALCKICV
jgi:hypothetical protein